LIERDQYLHVALEGNIGEKSPIFLLCQHATPYETNQKEKLPYCFKATICSAPIMLDDVHFPIYQQ
jgi:hypothetical protein